MKLYESIINDIAKIVKSYLNEGKYDFGYFIPKIS